MSEHADPIPPVEVEVEVESEAPEVAAEDRVARLDPETRARRCGSYASTATPRSRAARCRSSASTTRCAKRCGAWGS
jgi:hypothetical protein